MPDGVSDILMGRLDDVSRVQAHLLGVPWAASSACLTLRTLLGAGDL